MKQFYVLMFAICATVTASKAQFQKGDVLFGPSVSIGSSSQNDDYFNGTSIVTSKQSNFSLGVGISAIKMKSAKVGWGLGLGYGLSSSKASNLQTIYVPDNKSNNNNFSLSIFRRQYFSLGNKWNIYYDAGLSGTYLTGKTDYTQPSTSFANTKNTGYSGTLYFAPGISYSLNKKLLLDVRLNNLLALTYQNSTVKQEYTAGTLKHTISNFGFNSTISSNNFLNNVAFSLMWVL